MVVVINCDKAEEQYIECIRKMPTRDWYAMPFDAYDAIARVEDVAQAANIPKVSILNGARSLDEPAIRDIKQMLLKGAPSDDKFIEECLKEILVKLN